MVLLTRKEYDALAPKAQGYASYMQAAHQGSEVPDDNHYAENSDEWTQWRDGRFAAYLDMMEVEE